MKSTLCLRNGNDAFAQLRHNLADWNIPPEFTDEIIERHIAVAFEKGALVFAEGSTDGMLGCILSGYVKIYCSVADGGRTLVRLASPGEIIGYADFIDSKSRRAKLFEAQSSSKCTLALISRDHLARLLPSLTPDGLFELLQALNTFWSKDLRWFATLLGLSFTERLEAVFNDLAQRAGVSDARGTILMPELAHEDLAEMIGCSRAMISRIIAEMVASGRVDHSAKQYILLKKWTADKSPTSAAPQKTVDVVASPGLSARANWRSRSAPPITVAAPRPAMASAGR